MLLPKDKYGESWRVDLEGLPERQKFADGFLERDAPPLRLHAAGMLFEAMLPDSTVVALAAFPAL